ncbi:DUF1801 domain-containing protein [Shimia sp. W99]
MAPVPPIADPKVAAAFEAFAPDEREMLLQLRRLILEVAAENKGVGRIEEMLKWGQPAYLTPETKSGSTIRLGVPKSGGIAIFAHCQTSIISDFDAVFPGDFTLDGNRAVLLPTDADLPLDALRMLIRSGLIYHL